MATTQYQGMLEDEVARLAENLKERFGAFALSRAAGIYTRALAHGDEARIHMMSNVIGQLRQETDMRPVR